VNCGGVERSGGGPRLRIGGIDGNCGGPCLKVREGLMGAVPAPV
jgi:hypothetical protein